MDPFNQPKVYDVQSAPGRYIGLWVVGILFFGGFISALIWPSAKPPKGAPVAPPVIQTQIRLAPTPDRASLIEALKPHLLAHLPFAGSLNDHSTHALKVDAHGSVQLDGDSAFFPGDAYLELPHLEFNDRPFAVSMWLQPEAPVRNYGLLEQNEGPPHKHLYLMLSGSDKPCLGFFMDDLNTTESVPSGAWSHLVFQFSGAQQQIWLNARMIASRTSDPYKGTAGTTLIGKAPRWDKPPTQGYRGRMRELRIYDRDLNGMEIRALAGIEIGAVPESGRSGQF